MAETAGQKERSPRKLNIKRADESLGIIFVGGCGINNARMTCRETDPVAHPHLHLACVNTDSAQLHRYFGTYDADPKSNLNAWLDMKDRLVIEQLGTDGNGAGGNPDVGKESAETSMEKLLPFIQRCGTLIIVGGFGGGTGTGAIPLIAQRVQEMGKTALAIVTMPFLCEGRLDIANKALEEMRQVPTIVVYNEKLPQKDIRPSQAWAMINDGCLKSMIEVLRKMILDVGNEINTDLNDLRAVLKTGNYIQFGYARTTRDESFNLDEFTESLLHNPYQDTSIIENAEMLHLLFNGNWTISEIQRITVKICGENENRVKVHCGVSEEGDDLWVGMVAAAKIPPKVDARPAAKPAVEAKQVSARSDVHRALPPNRVIVQFLVQGKQVPLTIDKSTREEWTRAKQVEDEEILERLRDEILLQTGHRPDHPMRPNEINESEEGNGSRFSFLRR